MIPTIANLTSQERKIIFLSSLGGALEFYDFVIYMFFANELSQLFFPHQNHLQSLMGIFAVFAIGYLIRPLGGIVFSHFGDKYGRKKTFVASVILMALPTFLIGFLPTNNQIGILATILLIFLRILQGLAVGGEIPGAITFAGEHIKPQYRGLTCGIIFFGLNMGMILGSVISFLLTSFFSDQQLLAWGWRIPFILGGLLGLVSYYLRKSMTETPIFNNFKKEIAQENIPTFIALRYYALAIVKGLSLTWLGSVVVCLLYLYLPTYLTAVLQYPKHSIVFFNTLNIFLFSVIVIITSWFSDLFGRRIMLSIGALGFILFSYELFSLLTIHNVNYVIIAMIAFSILSACITGVYPCTLLELFPTRIRYTGVAISYNVGFAIFGGLSPLIATYLIHLTGDPLAPSYYLILSAVICIVSTLFLKEKHGMPLDK